MSEPPNTLIGLRTALSLYALLVLIALRALHGKFLTLALIILLALAAKTLVDHQRRQM
jgi:hypothetical protein